MSLHLSDIASDPAHRHRARTILTALTIVSVRCGLVLMGGQTARAVGVELFVVIAASRSSCSEVSTKRSAARRGAARAFYSERSVTRLA